MKSIEKKVHFLLKLKYQTNNDMYNRNVIENIIFDERTHLVSKFKEFLLYEDDYEYIKKYYSSKESEQRLENVLEYYHKNSLLYPNYSILPESDFLYKNIELKQKLIDYLESNKNDNKKKKDNDENDKIFSSNIYDSIIKGSENCLSLISCSMEKDNGSIMGINKIIKNLDINDVNKKKSNGIIQNFIKKRQIYTKKTTLNNSLSIKKNKKINLQIPNINNEYLTYRRIYKKNNICLTNYPKANNEQSYSTNNKNKTPINKTPKYNLIQNNSPNYYNLVDTPVQIIVDDLPKMKIKTKNKSNYINEIQLGPKTKSCLINKNLLYNKKKLNISQNDKAEYYNVKKDIKLNHLKLNTENISNLNYIKKNDIKIFITKPYERKRINYTINNTSNDNSTISHNSLEKKLFNKRIDNKNKKYSTIIANSQINPYKTNSLFSKFNKSIVNEYVSRNKNIFQNIRINNTFNLVNKKSNNYLLNINTDRGNLSKIINKGKNNITKTERKKNYNNNNQFKELGLRAKLKLINEQNKLEKRDIKKENDKKIIANKISKNKRIKSNQFGLNTLKETILRYTKK